MNLCRSQWRETVKRTSHGKYLDVLRDKMRERTTGGANSLLRLFQEFRRCVRRRPAPGRLTVHSDQTSAPRLSPSSAPRTARREHNI